jgi:hypothetical protein
MNYQPDDPLDVQTWRAATEDERIEACLTAHAMLPPWHPPVPNARLHASLHVVVEQQIASGEFPEMLPTLERLRKEGLSRHQAVHLISGIAAEALRHVMTQRVPFDREAYARSLRALKAPPPEGA